MKELDKPAALFNAPDDYDRSYIDPQTLGYDLSDMEPMVKRPRPAERCKTNVEYHQMIIWATQLSSDIPIQVFPVMLYVRKRDEQIYMPLHVVPPNLVGLAQAIGNKFGIDSDKVG